MIHLPPPENDAERVQALRNLQLLDTPYEEEYDHIIGLAASIARTPIALFSLIDQDRQWFKAKLGLDSNGTPREQAFCDHAIRSDEVFIVPDATVDPRFSDNPIVTDDPHVRFYAGVPIRTIEGHAIGTLCVIDRVPRTLSQEELDALVTLATHIQHHIRMVESERMLVQRFFELRDDVHSKEQRYNMAVTLLSIVAHDVRGPLASIAALCESITPQDLTQEMPWLLDEIHRQSTDARNLLDQVLAWARTVLGGVSEPQAIYMSALVTDVVRPNSSALNKKGILVEYDVTNEIIIGNSNTYRFILNTLLTNALKFTEHGTITIRVHTTATNVTISVSDTGTGMSPEQIAKIFSWGKKQGSMGTRKEQGAGMGLLLLNDVVDSLGGTISVQSELTKGTTFLVNLPVVLAAEGSQQIH